MWAFSDESERAAVMLIATVIVAPGDIDGARSAMRGLLVGSERRIHAANESHRRRRQVLDVIARHDEITATVLRYRRAPGVDRVAARQTLIEAATTVVVKASVSLWTLDDIPPSQRARDRNIIGHALRRADPAVPVVFDHRPSHEEPLLWAADAICWATGAGGDWRRRIEAILTVIDIQP